MCVRETISNQNNVEPSPNANSQQTTSAVPSNRKTQYPPSCLSVHVKNDRRFNIIVPEISEWQQGTPRHVRFPGSHYPSSVFIKPDLSPDERKVKKDPSSREMEPNPIGYKSTVHLSKKL